MYLHIAAQLFKNPVKGRHRASEERWKKERNANNWTLGRGQISDQATLPSGGTPRQIQGPVYPLWIQRAPAQYNPPTSDNTFIERLYRKGYAACMNRIYHCSIQTIRVCMWIPQRKVKKRAGELRSRFIFCSNANKIDDSILTTTCAIRPTS